MKKKKRLEPLFGMDKKLASMPKSIRHKIKAQKSHSFNNMNLGKYMAMKNEIKSAIGKPEEMAKMKMKYPNYFKQKAKIRYL